jgi:predicted ABC-type ATPase
MLTRIDSLIAERSSFMVETTLASLTYLQKIRLWRKAGYVVALIYLRLPTVQMSLERVRRRIVGGGHGIPEDVIRQRFARLTISKDITNPLWMSGMFGTA